jgi:PEP-CTERM motif
MLNLRRRLQPKIMNVAASAALACIGSVAFMNASQAAAVTFNHTGSDVSYVINPGAYRITVFGAQGGDATGCSPGTCDGGRGAEASAIFRIGQTLDLQISVGGAAPSNAVAAGGGGASYVNFITGDPGLAVLLLVGGGGGGGLSAGPLTAAGGDGKTTRTDPHANGVANGGGGGGGGFSSDGQFSNNGDGGTSLSSGGAPGQEDSPGGFGGGGGGATGVNLPGGGGGMFGGGGGGGYNGGDGGWINSVVFAAQGGTSYVNDNTEGCTNGQGPACFIGGLVLAVGAGGDGQGQGNGSVIIEPIGGSPVPEPSTWAMLLLGFAGLGFAALRRGAIRAHS